LAEWREGVWCRPDNLVAGPPELDGCTWVRGARIESPPPLWDLDGWAATGRDLLARMSRELSLADRFVLAAAVVRHLRDDPQLPTAMLPPGWPGRELRSRYDAYERAIRQDLRPIMQDQGGGDRTMPARRRPLGSG
jgi:phenylacetic acid degradation operon negative regulatory protein